MYEYVTVFIKYLANVYTIIQILAKPSVSAMQSLVQEMMQFIERTKKETSLTNIINQLEFLESIVLKHILQNKKIKDQLIIFKNTSIAKSSIQKSLS